MSHLDLSFLRAPGALRRIALGALACAALGALHGLLAPRWYQAALTVVPARSRPAFPAPLAGELGGLAAGFDASLGAADAARIAAVLQSVSVSDAVVERLDLRSRYGERTPEAAREALWRHCEVTLLAKPNLVQLTCEDRDPRFLQGMLAYFGEHGNLVFRRVGVSSAAEEVRFLERRVGELRGQADEAAARLRAFQEQHRVVDLDTQARAVVGALSSLNGQSIAKQLEVEYAQRFSSREEATLRQLQAQLAVVDAKMRGLEEPAPAAEGARPRRAAGGGLFPPALAVPGLRAELEQLVRERRVVEAVLVTALERLEAAKAAEARDVSTFQILDPPPVAVRPWRPRPAQSLLTAAIAGLAGAAALEWLRQRRAAAASKERT